MNLPLGYRILRVIGAVLIRVGTVLAMPGQFLVMVGVVLTGGNRLEVGK